MAPSDDADAATRTTPGAAFRQGLTQPSLLGVLVAAIAALVPLLALAATIDEAFMASDAHHRLALGKRDHAVSVTSNVLRAERTRSDRPRIALVGASSTRTSVNLPVLESRIEALTGRRVETVNLTFGGQSLPESLALLERMTGSSPIVAVVGVGPARLGKGHEWATGPTGGSRVGIRSRRLDAVVREAGSEPRPRSDNYLWDNRGFVLPRVSRLLRSAFVGPPDHEAMPFYGYPAPSPRVWRRRTNRQARVLDGYAENAERGIASLHEIAAYDRAREDVAVVLLHSPVNPRFVDERGLGGSYEDARERLDRFAAQTGLPLLRLSASCGITADDFADGTHLRVPEKIDRYTELLAERIVAGGWLDAVDPR